MQIFIRFSFLKMTGNLLDVKNKKKTKKKKRKIHVKNLSFRVKKC